MQASVECNRDFPEIWLTLRVDENSDVTCDRIWKDEDISIASVSMSKAGGGDMLECELMASGRTVRIRGLGGKETYDLQLGYDAPQDLIDTVHLPTFRLELHRPPTPSKRQVKKKGGEGPSAN